MKYCTKCGKELMDESVICVGCGCSVVENKNPQFAPATQKPKAAMILGIVGIVFAWLFALVGHIVSIIGIVVGIKEYKTTEKMTGLILSIVGEVCAIFSSIIGAAMMTGLY
ncbi:MAG: hypothetical protein IJB75_05095 [Oscillospiraceae bacterium]|nr:hypothetical protein [Oscillospiraceae bacterium]